jgi:SAM-dependent methyltransferase/peptidoglycan hydrolase CwlO-like protein
MHPPTPLGEGDTNIIPLRGWPQTEVVPDVDLDDLNSPHTLAVLSVPAGATVLDVGCGAGVVARALAARGCMVWGLEMDARRAASARHHCVEVLEADVEAVNLQTEFEGQTFDVVLCLDVLEHLRNPTATLGQVATVLAPGGSVVISIPNITHGALRLELLRGRFRYRPSGLLDRGHLRFFDADGVDELIREAGLHAETTLRVIRRLDQTEFDVDVTAIPSAVRTSLESDVDALTYQFFVIARPGRVVATARPPMSLLERQRARTDELAAALDSGASYARHLEAQLAAKDERLLDLEGHVAHARHDLESKDARLCEAERIVEHVSGDLAAKAARLAELQQVLADLKRLADDNDAYVRHLEGQVRHCAGQIAIRDDEISVARVHIEKTERTIGDRDREIAERDRTLDALHSGRVDAEQAIAQLQAAVTQAEQSTAQLQATVIQTEARLAESRELAVHLSWVIHQPRHRLASACADTIVRRLPRLHRLLRPMVLRLLHRSERHPQA